MPEQEKLFHDLLAGHLKAGTAPKADLPGGWAVPVFAKKAGVGERTVRTWLDGSRTPEEKGFDAIRGALFGDDPRHDTASVALEQAWEAARAKRGQAGRPKRVPDARPEAGIAPPDRCLGRDAEVARLVAVLLGAGAASALVLGEGGVGKTTLTRAAASTPEAIARFGPRRHEVELVTAHSAAAMQDAIAGALGADPKQGMAGIKARLAAGPSLLVLDNLETPWEAEPKPVEALLRALAEVPGLALMASVRGAESPRTRWGHRCDLSPLGEAEARALFREIAHRIPEDDPELAALLAELGGLPLAIELVARQAEPDASARRVLAAWRRLGPSLADGRADPAHRHASLARSIEVSLASPRLGEAGKRLFRLLGALPAGLAAEDEAPLLGDAAAQAVRELRAVGLAREREGRLDLLPPVRRHAADKHPPMPEEQRGWVGHYLGLAREQGERVGATGGAAAAARLRPELGNLDAAFAAAAGCGMLGEAVRTIQGYGRFSYILGLGGAGLRTLAASCRDAGDRLGEANCSYRLADIARARSDYAAAHAGFEAALLIYREIDSRLGEANCIRRFAKIALARSDHAAAQAGYEAALPITREIDDRRGEASCIRGLADIAFERSDHAAAQEGYETALPIYRETGARLGEVNCIKSLADIALRRSDHAAAQAGFEAALSIFREIGARLGEANCIQSLADIALERSDHAAARAGYEAALPIYREVSNLVGEAICLVRFGELAAAEGAAEEAGRLFDQSIALFDSVGSAGNAAHARDLRQRLGV